MRSSISNSNIEVLTGNWRRTWVISLLVAFALLFLWEGAWRAHGFKPMVADSPALWAEARRGVKSDSVVLIGSSRMGVGVDPKVYAEVTGIKPIQLAVNASSPVPVLKHLAEDESFKGTVICELSEVSILTDDNAPMALISTRHVNEYQSQSISKRVEYRLNNFLQQHLVTAMPEVNPYRVLKSVLSGKLPQPPHVSMYPDRTRLADFSKVDLQKIKENGLNRLTVGNELVPKTFFLEMAARLEAAVARIQSRGGRVIFVRMPTSGAMWEYTEATSPKREYWDEFAARTSAATIHFKDYPELADFECPDYSHLDRRDVPAFTTALARIIMERDARR